MGSDVKLKPCPFCGGEAELQESEDLMPDVLPAFWVSCKARCAAQTELSRDEAVERWNRRAPSPATETANERFERMAKLVENAWREGYEEAEREHDSFFRTFEPRLSALWEASDARKALTPPGTTGEGEA